MEISAIANTGRHGDDRLIDQAADDAGQGPFHTGNDDDDIGLTDIVGAGGGEYRLRLHHKCVRLHCP